MRFASNKVGQVNRLAVIVLSVGLAVLLGACRTAPQATPFSVTVPAIADAGASPVPSVTPRVTAVPTIDTQPTRTPTPLPTPTATLTRFPTNTPPPSRTPTATITSTPLSINSPTPSGETAEPGGTPSPTWTPPALDPAVTLPDHLFFRRPIGDGGTNWVDRSYPYGSTQGGRLQVHHGVEFQNDRGTEVLAVGDGTVIHAGDDLSIMFGPQGDYYGQLVVVQHDVVSPEGLPVYSLYGHIDRWTVTTGNRVTAGQVVGVVGDRGIAQGPHLHFEIRVGDPFSFDSTRNPELWFHPYGGFGTLVGRVTDSSGNILNDVTIQVRSADLTRNAFSYADSSVNPDDMFQENFTLGDIPANYYDVSVRADNRLRFQKLIYVYPNRTTWIDIQLRD